MRALDYYHKWLETNNVGFGLCCSPIGKFEEFRLVSPTNDDIDILHNEALSLAFWGSGLSQHALDRDTSFTPLRQNLVLLIAALREEL